MKLFLSNTFSSQTKGNVIDTEKKKPEEKNINGNRLKPFLLQLS